MKRPVLLGCIACVIAGVVACSASGTPGPGSTAPPVTPVTPAPPSPPANAGAAATANLDAVTVATAYYRAVAAQQYQTAFGYLAADATGPDGQRLTWPLFRQLASTMDGQEGTVTDFSADPSGSMVVMTIGRPAVGRYHAHLTVRRDSADWRITGIDRI